MKKCSACKIEKEFNEFKKHRSRADGLSSQCKKCINEKRKLPEFRKQSLEQQRQWRNRPENFERQKNWSKKFRTSERGKKYILNDALRRNYGITLDQYNDLFQKQKGCCAVCLTHQSEFSKRLSVDHDHETGEIRELLCHHCNTALGAFDENIDLLFAAMEYLKKHKSKVITKETKKTKVSEVHA